MEETKVDVQVEVADGRVVVSFSAPVDMLTLDAEAAQALGCLLITRSGIAQGLQTGVICTPAGSPQVSADQLQ